MKKRYMLLLFLVPIAIILWFVLSQITFHTAQAPVVQQVDTLAPDTPPAQKGDMIIVDSPRPQSTVTSPLVIKGKARGNWFFEGSFPVTLTNWDGLIIAEGYATAQGDWMTNDYVPFSATLSYSLPEDIPYRRGFLILRKDNPSGEPQFDDSIEIMLQL